MPADEGRSNAPQQISKKNIWLLTFLEFYRTVKPDPFQDAARTAATGKVKQEHFQFPDCPTGEQNDTTAIRHGRALSALDFQLASHAFVPEAR